MKKIRYILGLVFLISACAGNQKSYTSLSNDQFLELLEDSSIQLLDVRSQEEFDDSHIKQAMLIDLGDSLFAEKAVDVLDKERPVAVYCRTGRRSKKASAMLIEQGFKVYELDGAISSWMENDFPTQK